MKWTLAQNFSIYKTSRVLCADKQALGLSSDCGRLWMECAGILLMFTGHSCEVAGWGFSLGADNSVAAGSTYLPWEPHGTLPYPLVARSKFGRLNGMGDACIFVTSSHELFSVLKAFILWFTSLQSAFNFIARCWCCQKKIQSVDKKSMEQNETI